MMIASGEHFGAVERRAVFHCRSVAHLCRRGHRLSGFVRAKSDTVLRWHRRANKICWRWISKTETPSRLPLGRETYQVDEFGNAYVPAWPRLESARAIEGLTSPATQ